MPSARVTSKVAVFLPRPAPCPSAGVPEVDASSPAAAAALPKDCSLSSPQSSGSSSSSASLILSLSFLISGTSQHPFLIHVHSKLVSLSSNSSTLGSPEKSTSHVVSFPSNPHHTCMSSFFSSSKKAPVLR